MNWPQVWQLTLQNALLGVVSALIGLLVAVPAGLACVRWRWLYPPVLSGANIIYAVPSLALFIVLIPVTGLSNETVIIALALFSLCVIIPNVVDGLRLVDDSVRQAATGMGFGPLRRLTRVELPLAAPVIIAGLRVAMVSSISLASVGQLIGVGSLGYLFIDGLQREYAFEIYVGVALVVALALTCDLVLVLARRMLTPWQRGRLVAAQPGGRALAVTADGQHAEARP